MLRGACPVVLACLAFSIPQATAFADIRIAVAGPASGQFKLLGEQMRLGAAEAVADINASGGIEGERLALETADDRCDEDRATAVANRLVGRNVVAVVGHLCSAASIAGAQVYSNAGIVQISPASASPAFTDNRPDPAGGTYRLIGREDDQPKVAGRFLATHYPGRRVAFLNDGTAYGKGLADGALAAFEAGGGNPVFTRAYEAGLVDYSNLVAILRNQRIDVVFLGGYHVEAAIIVRQMRQRGMDAVVMGGDALLTADFHADAGDAADGTLMTFAPDPRNDETARSVVDRLRSRGAEPELFTLHAYAAVQILAQAIARSGSMGYDDISRTLNEGRFDTVIGTLAFDSKGDMSLPGYVVYRWRDGWYEELTDLD